MMINRQYKKEMRDPRFLTVLWSKNNKKRKYLIVNFGSLIGYFLFEQNINKIIIKET